MSESEHQTTDSLSQQRKMHTLHDVLEYIFVITISLSAISAALISFSGHFIFFSDQFKAIF
ncbi:hypothetical protein [Bartonella rattaustraliani]|uniref:hypothetical protein n=1 Tax=Bartonella rattaustraliani TaxID=481139 RepID=UPI0002EEF483|nr:hypothetical protein [Bartonella rattaustraliani]